MDHASSAAQRLDLATGANALLLAARPKQWTKNLLIFLALFFTINEAWELQDLSGAASTLGKAALAFLIFSVLSSAIYLINDAVDVESDRLHPRKRLRPIAAGLLPIPVAVGAAAMLIPAGLASAFLLVPLFGLVSLVYVATMVAYTFVLKRLILLDVFAISGGFVLRAVAGAAVLQVPISPWLYICAGLGALLIALAKRRSELETAGDQAGAQRATLEWYTVGLLDQFITAMATAVVLAYTLYTFTAENLPENHAMMLTIPFVVYGLFRYMYLVHVKNLGESPEEIVITDAPLIACILLWLVTSATVLVVYRA